MAAGSTIPVNVAFGTTGVSTTSQAFSNVSMNAEKMGRTIDRTIATTRTMSGAFSQLAMVSPRLSTAFFAIEDSLARSEGSMKRFLTTVAGGAAFAALGITVMKTADAFKELSKAQEDAAKAGVDPKVIAQRLGWQEAMLEMFGLRSSPISLGASQSTDNSIKRLMATWRPEKEGQSSTTQSKLLGAIAARLLTAKATGERDLAAEIAYREIGTGAFYARGYTDADRLASIEARVKRAQSLRRRISQLEDKGGSVSDIQFASGADYQTQAQFQSIARSRAEARGMGNDVPRQQLDELRLARKSLEVIEDNLGDRATIEEYEIK
jgi:hypothetical protein